MKIEECKVFGFESAIRGMRNPMDSWAESDSRPDSWGFYLGPKDLKLACKLVRGGSEHRKFLREIKVSVDLTLPRYVWTELDTYKVATVRNSCSTMHKLGSRDLTQEDFELGISEDYLRHLNRLGERLADKKNVGTSREVNDLRHQYKNDLPEGYLQKATYSMSYETALAMYFQRRKHRLPEWRADVPGSICSFIHGLPYMSMFVAAAESKEGERRLQVAELKARIRELEESMAAVIAEPSPPTVRGKPWPVSDD